MTSVFYPQAADGFGKGFLFMRRIEVKTGKPYEILVERSISGRVGAERRFAAAVHLRPVVYFYRSIPSPFSR